MVVGSSRAPIGRDAELAELADWASAGLSGSGAALVVSGDAGIGKTTVLETFARRLAAEQVLVGTGHCVDLGGSPLPYLPFVEVFERIRAARPERIAAVLDARPALARLLAHADPGERANGAQMDLFEAVRTGLEDLSAGAGLLVWIEDVHWADQSSLDLLTYLFTRGLGAPVLLAVSYRSDDLHRRHPLRRVLTQWSRLPVRRLDLRPLAPESIGALVRSLEQAPSDPDLIRGVVERAEGNAFYAEELATAAGSSGRGELPADLTDLLMFRVNALGESARAVVRAAAVGGRRVRHDVLADVVGLDADALAVALREALDAQILQTEDDAFVFRHALLAEAVAADLLPGERVRLHTGYVRALRSHPLRSDRLGQARSERSEQDGRNGRDESASDLARHAIAAGDDETALRASVAAGQDALAVGGPEEGLAHLEAALELLDQGRVDASVLGPELDDTDVVLLASIAAEAAGQQERAIALVRERLNREGRPEEDRAGRPVGGGPRVRIRLLEALAAALIMSDYEDPLPYSTEALALMPDDGSELRARVLRTHASALSGRGRYGEAMHWGEEAHRIARRLDRPTLAAEAATLVARMRNWLGEDTSAVLELESVAEQARGRNDPIELRARYLLAMLSYERGDLDRASTLFLATAGRSRELGRPWAPYGIDGRSMAAITLYVQGRWDEALDLTALRGEKAPGLAAAALRVAAMSVHAGRGDPDTAEDAAAVRDWWRGDGVIAVLSIAAGIDARGDAGEVDGAIALHDEGVEFVAHAWAEPDFLARIRLSALLLGQLGTAAARMPERSSELADRGPELLEAAVRAYRIAEERRPQGPESTAWLARAEAEAARLRWLAGAEAPGPGLLDRWQRSVAAFTTFPHRFERARSRARLAAVLRATGDRTDARSVTEEVTSTATSLGARPLLRELAELVPAGERGTVLTPRETEVLSLVADGLSNADIGRRLVISTKTASVHVSNILAKLDAQSRTDAAAVARRRGLLETADGQGSDR